MLTSECANEDVGRFEMTVCLGTTAEDACLEGVGVREQHNIRSTQV